MQKTKMMITITVDRKKRLKEFSEKYAISMSGMLNIALEEYLKKNTVKIKPTQPPEPRIRQCRNLTCACPYDTNKYDACPRCGSAEIYAEENGKIVGMKEI